MDNRLKQQLDFSLEIDKEKNILRQTHLSGHGRQENDAEHAWHMAIMAYLLREYSNEQVDIGKVMLMCLIHDIVEIDAGDTYAYDDVTKDVEDIYEWGFTNDPWKKLGIAREKKMPAGTTMVPRVFKTNVGDIMTTNTINETTLAIGDLLTPGATDGILAKAGAANADMQWQVVKLYDMPDGQKAAKVMGIK